MKRWTMLVGAVLLAVGIAGACSSSSDSSSTPTPAPKVAVNFTVIDSTGTFGPNELQWKGSMKIDAATRTITKDTTWGGPYPVLYDDGPWDVTSIAGHEPSGSTAGDHHWGVTVYVTPPETGTDTYEYGLVDAAYQNSTSMGGGQIAGGNGWIWKGGNGTFAVPAGRTAPINATGMTIPAWGTIDLELTVNATDMATALTTTAGAPTLTKIGVKGGAWGWNTIWLADDGAKGDATASDHIYTMHLSEYAGTGKPFFHTGLLHAGDKPEFVFVYNYAGHTDQEYKDANGVARFEGVAAKIKPSTTWDPATVVTTACANDKNTCVVVP